MVSFYDTTFWDKQLKKEINEAMGQSISLLKRLDMDGIGSPRFNVEDVSPAFEVVMNRRTNVNYGTMEIRPKGLIVHFAKALKSFAWLIPYYKLAIFQGEQLQIHADGQFIKIRKDNQSKALRKFIIKLLEYKEEYLQHSKPPL